MIAFLTSKLGLSIIAGLLVIALFFGWLTMHDAAIEHNSLLTYNNKQLELSIKNQEEIKLKLDDVKKLGEERVAALVEQNRILDTKKADITTRIGKIEGGSTPSSRILKETIRELRQ